MNISLGDGNLHQNYMFLQQFSSNIECLKYSITNLTTGHSANKNLIEYNIIKKFDYSNDLEENKEERQSIDIDYTDRKSWSWKQSKWYWL